MAEQRGDAVATAPSRSAAHTAVRPSTARPDRRPSLGAKPSRYVTRRHSSPVLELELDRVKHHFVHPGIAGADPGKDGSDLDPLGQSGHQLGPDAILADEETTAGW